MEDNDDKVVSNSLVKKLSKAIAAAMIATTLAVSTYQIYSDTIHDMFVRSSVFRDGVNQEFLTRGKKIILEEVELRDKDIKGAEENWILKGKPKEERIVATELALRQFLDKEFFHEEDIIFEITKKPREKLWYHLWNPKKLEDYEISIFWLNGGQKDFITSFRLNYKLKPVAGSVVENKDSAFLVEARRICTAAGDGVRKSTSEKLEKEVVKKDRHYFKKGWNPGNVENWKEKQQRKFWVYLGQKYAQDEEKFLEPSREREFARQKFVKLWLRKNPIKM
ncbi:MAG: hypothetical protein QGH47_04010 [Candidatus Woesearchaeota archaeon]|jgi:hypothetical protein|nr:hypothetical protein [Candidatus Woesearchaeota archaeon]